MPSVADRLRDADRRDARMMAPDVRVRLALELGRVCGALWAQVCRSR